MSNAPVTVVYTYENGTVRRIHDTPTMIRRGIPIKHGTLRPVHIHVIGGSGAAFEEYLVMYLRYAIHPEYDRYTNVVLGS